MSLSQLSQAFTAMLGTDNSATVSVSTSSQGLQNAVTAEIRAEVNSIDPADQIADDRKSITPRSILEAVLFVGRPDNVPLTSEQIADLMQTVSPEEIDRLIEELNTQYLADHCPYCVASEGDGYRMVLRSEHQGLRDRFYGRIRVARLSPAAVEVLSLVAYREPLTADEVSRLRGLPSGHILRQLVQRQLLRLERGQSKPRKSKYFTTHRFLEVFGLNSLNDLPRSDDPARS